MAHLQVTIDTDKLKDLFASDEGMAELAEEVLNQVLEAQMTDHTAAPRRGRTLHQRPHRRWNQRGGIPRSIGIRYRRQRV